VEHLTTGKDHLALGGAAFHAQQRSHAVYRASEVHPTPGRIRCEDQTGIAMTNPARNLQKARARGQERYEAEALERHEASIRRAASLDAAARFAKTAEKMGSAEIARRHGATPCGFGHRWEGTLAEVEAWVEDEDAA
jgi:hypothetical protein